MSRERGIKRYEPMGYLLVMSTMAMSGTMVFVLYKFARNVINKTITAPVIDESQWAGAGVLILGVMLMVLAQHFFRKQKLDSFRAVFGISFFVLLFFLVLQTANILFSKAKATASPEELGRYYFSFITGLYMLFLLVGLVGHAVILGRIYRRISYVESFIFSVNPPNILNLKLLIRYMIFITVLWLSIIIFVKSYAA
jgi:cytochrome c oxidase subunit 3